MSMCFDYLTKVAAEAECIQQLRHLLTFTNKNVCTVRDVSSLMTQMNIYMLWNWKDSNCWHKTIKDEDTLIWCLFRLVSCQMQPAMSLVYIYFLSSVLLKSCHNWSPHQPWSTFILIIYLFQFPLHHQITNNVFVSLQFWHTFDFHVFSEVAASSS